MHMPAILITDDDDFIVQVLSQWFAGHGFAVDVARDGLEAVDKCRKRVYDVVTMDIEMPNMGGLDAIRLIREFCPTMPIIALTGYVNGADWADRCRADKILAKPMALSALEREVRSLLRPTAVGAMTA